MIIFFSWSEESIKNVIVRFFKIYKSLIGVAHQFAIKNNIYKLYNLLKESNFRKKKLK